MAPKHAGKNTENPGSSISPTLPIAAAAPPADQPSGRQGRTSLQQVMGPRGRARRDKTNIARASKGLSKFSGQNFTSWKLRTRHVLTGEKLLSIVEGTEPEPTPVDPEDLTIEEEEAILEWHDANQSAISILGMGLSDGLYSTFMDSDLASDIWTSLNERYDVNTTYERNEIHFKLTQRDLGGKSVSQHIDMSEAKAQ